MNALLILSLIALAGAYAADNSFAVLAALFAVVGFGFGAFAQYEESQR